MTHYDIQAGNKNYQCAQNSMSLMPNYYRWIYSRIRKYIQGNVVELGAGAGFFIPLYRNSSHKFYPVDFNTHLLDLIRLNYPYSNIYPIKTDLGNYPWNALKNISVNTILALDVLEHFEDDEKFVRSVNEILHVGGKFIVKVPAIPKLYNEVDVASGHFRRYDPKDLDLLMNRYGFIRKDLCYINKLGALVYRFKKNRKTNFSRTFSPMTLKAINLFIPLLQFIDKILLWKGLSLIGVYEKREELLLE